MFNAIFIYAVYLQCFSLAEFRANVLIKMSVSVAHIKTNDDEPVMSWNLTVPCRISAELWPCQLEADGQCREIKGFRQHHLKDWEENSTKLWVNIWEYVNFDMNGFN